MRIRWPTIARCAYWRIQAGLLQVESWEALVREIPDGATIAIVGNAGYLLDAAYGRQIDDHDIVIRMNNFRLDGYQRSIGSRVDMVLTNFSPYSIVFDNPDLKRARLFVSSRPMNFLRHPQLGLCDRLGLHVTAGMRALGATRVFVPNLPYFVDHTRRLGVYPTTGLMALYLVVDILADRCARLFLTGFSFFQGRSHYFSKLSIDAAKLHNIEAERSAFRETIRQHQDWIHTDPVMQGYLEGTDPHGEVTVASARRSA